MKNIIKNSLCISGTGLPLLLNASAGAEISSDKIERLPNIVFILADDMGIGDVSALNPEGKIKTANIDKLVDNGMTFTDAHTSSSVCTPSRYGIITGRYCWRSKFKGRVLGGYSPCIIPEDRETVASMLKKKGYDTAVIGKWHLGLTFQKKDGSVIKKLKPGREVEKDIDFTKPVKLGPNDLGFDYFFGIAGSWNMPPFAFFKNRKLQYSKLVHHAGPIAPLPDELKKAQEANLPKQELKRIKRKYPKIVWDPGVQDINVKPQDAMPAFKKETVKYLNARKGSSKPFFLYLPLSAPHCPIVPNKQFIGKSGAGLYGDFVLEVDDFVGTVVETLKKDGLYDNTILIFSADNGYSRKGFPDFQKEKYHHNPSYIYAGCKARMTEGGHRVPFIVVWPSVVKKGSRCDDLVSLLDLYATFADIVGEKIPSDAAEDSISFLPDLLGNGHSARKRIAHQDFAGYLGIRDFFWKLILPSNPKYYQLYNLENDISEKHNLINDRPEKVKELKAVLKKMIKDGRSTPGPELKNDTPNNWKQLYWMNEASGQ